MSTRSNIAYTWFAAGARSKTKAIELCTRGGFEDILLRGEADFAQTQHLARWDDDGGGLCLWLHGRKKPQKRPRVKEQIVPENG